MRSSECGVRKFRLGHHDCPQKFSFALHIPHSTLKSVDICEFVEPKKDLAKVSESRGTIALILVWALVGVLVFSVVSSWFVMTTENRDALVRILEIVLTPLVALVGAVTGFYYGEKSK